MICDFNVSRFIVFKYLLVKGGDVHCSTTLSTSYLMKLKLLLKIYLAKTLPLMMS